MIPQRTWIILFICLQVALKVCESRVSVEIFFTGYQNPNHWEHSRECCVAQCSTCLSEITLCLQEMDERGDSCSLGMKSFNITSDDVEFSRSGFLGISDFTGISNPLSFSVDPVSFKIRVRIINAANGENIFMHTWDIDITADVINTNQTEMHRNRIAAEITYSYILSCAATYYGPDCSINCVEADDDTGHFRCDVNGNAVCLPGYTNSSTTDERCTMCVSETCTAAAAVLPSGSVAAAAAVLPSGSVAGIVIAVLIILAAVVVVVIGGIFLVIYRPWSDDFKVKRARAQSNSKSLNNPVYEEEAYNTSQNKKSKEPVNIGSDGAADLRDQTLRGHATVAADDSNPLYSSHESVLDGSKKKMEESTFMDNKSLVDVLDRCGPATISTQARAEITHESSNGAPLLNPNANFTDGLPPSNITITDANNPQDIVQQFDDETYEDITINSE